MGHRRRTDPERGRVIRFTRLLCVERNLPRDPLAVYAVLRAQGRDVQLLYSAPLPGGGDAPRSILALDPEPACSLPHDDPRDAFATLRAMQEACSFSGTPSADLPFAGGWVGYLAYDCLDRLESIPRRTKPATSVPDMEFSFHRRTLQYDPATHLWCATALLQEGDDPDAATAALADLLLLLDAPTPALPAPPFPLMSFRTNMNRDAYTAAVRRVLDYIRAGDVYQVCLSREYAGETPADPLALACGILARCPAPFAAALTFGSRTLLCTSPERFLRLDPEGHVRTEPIKGTRPRGRHREEDAAFLEQLRASGKEAAELAMITDLLRNDLGRVCAYGSVRVTEPRALRTHHNVHHAHSVIEGRLRPGCDAVELLRATLPGGSITGAPKIRAMQILEELEPHRRGAYCGCIGYLGVDGRMDLNIAIRTLWLDGRCVRIHAGSGIVAESDPGREFDETEHKARGILSCFSTEEVCDGTDGVDTGSGTEA